jgi:SAM-dependent methyltransferase
MDQSKYFHYDAFHRKSDAVALVPFFIQLFDPKSVLDVGCGTGNFMKAFIENGVQDVRGIEAAWIDKEKLAVSPHLITIIDLERPFTMNRRFDLILCLEVAEHLEEQSASGLISSLTSLSDVIIFSAAIPGQGGQNHVNEQWTSSYWQPLFQHKGYIMHDVVRPAIWMNEDIFWWYRQNIVVAVNINIDNAQESGFNDYVHPELYKMKLKELDNCKHFCEQLLSGKLSLAKARQLLRNV